MSVFSYDTSNSPTTIDVGQFVVYTAPITPGSDPTQDPTWDTWTARPELKFINAFYGSSVAGMSHAQFKFAPGQPYDDTDVNQYAGVSFGDRVCIVQTSTGADNPIFCGYCLGGRLEINESGEALIFDVVGPEWLWGDDGLHGAWTVICGQVRRNATADDAWAKSGTVANAGQLHRFTGERAVFNPFGRRNMSVDDCKLTADNMSTGRVWETPERTVKGTLKADWWTVAQALKTLELWFNDPWQTSGIQHPDYSGVDTTKSLPQTDIDGLGLWGAMKRVCGPEYGFYVDPRPPSRPVGTSWGPFTLSFFTRGQGPNVSIYLNNRGTLLTNAVASVVRAEAAKTIRKSPTKAIVLTRLVRHIKLQYLGAITPSATTAQKKLLLQHGWTVNTDSTKTDLDFADWADSNGIVDNTSIDNKGSGKLDTWRDQYTTNGKKFAKYQNAGRLFVWNESGEFTTDDTAVSPKYATTGFRYFSPDLAGIVDGEDDDEGMLCRKRRRIIDTPYFDTALDEWRRVRPTLLMAVAKTPTGTDLGPWIRIPTSHWRLDPERASIWITAPDISEWYPFADVQDPSEPAINDMRSFATLLHSGCLRMTLEGSVECDSCIEKIADRQSSAGSPFVRETVFRGDHDFIKSVVFNDGVTSQLGLTAQVADNTTQAMALAVQNRNAGQDQQTHASILCSADWPLQKIGGILTSIQGRNVNMTGGPSGRGAQIVALNLDPEAMKWEMLTESAALKLRHQDKARFKKGKVQARIAAAVTNTAGQSDVGANLGAPLPPEAIA